MLKLVLKLFFFRLPKINTKIVEETVDARPMPKYTAFFIFGGGNENKYQKFSTPTFIFYINFIVNTGARRIFFKCTAHKTIQMPLPCIQLHTNGTCLIHACKFLPKNICVFYIVCHLQKLVFWKECQNDEKRVPSPWQQKFKGPPHWQERPEPSLFIFPPVSSFLRLLKQS